MTRVEIRYHGTQRAVLVRRRHRRIPPVRALRFRTSLYPDTPHPYLHPLLAALVIAGVLLIVKVLGYLQ